MGGIPVTITDKGVPVSIQGDIPASAIPFGSPGDPAGPLGPDGKIPTSQLPPLEHDIARAATEAEMLALAVTTPAICIRTDFTPPHVFYLVADPATTLANWEDTGEFGASTANPSVLVGLTAKNGTADTVMRSDAAPALDQAIVPTWTDIHTFNGSTGSATASVILGNNNPEMRLFPSNGDVDARMWRVAVLAVPGQSSINIFGSKDSPAGNLGYAFQASHNGTNVLFSRLIAGAQNIMVSGAQDPGITSNSGAGSWDHTGAFSATGDITTTAAIAGNTTVTAGIGSNSVQMVGAAGGQDVKIRALGATDANVSIEMSAKGTGLLKMASPTTVAGNLTVSGEVSAAQGAGSASPTNSGIALATAPNWSMAQFYDAARTANNRSMDILFIGDGLHMRFVNDARNAFLDFLSVQGGQATGVTGMATTSGSGAWTHTGAFALAGNNSTIMVGGQAGTAGQVLTSTGNATTPAWASLPKAAAQADSTATDVAGIVADFNSLLAKLRTAGIIAT